MDVKTDRIIAIVLSCMAFNMPLMAQSSPTDIEKAQQQNNQIIQQFQQQQKALQNKRDDQLPNILFKLKTAPKLTNITTKPNAVCFQISSIIIQGVSLISDEQLQAIKQPFINQCLNLNKINNVVKQITLRYVAQGFVTSRAYIPKQDLSQGILFITVIEGQVEKIETSQASTINTLTAFPNVQGKPLNLRDIEQGIEQLNRLSVNQTSMNLLPGKEIGATIIQLKNTRTSPWQSQLSIDNSGQKTTGEYQSKLMVSVDNAFNLNDYLSLTIQNDVLNPNSSGDSNSLTLRYEIPYGYWLYSLDANWYDYKNTIKGAVTNFESSGKSQSQTLKAKYIWQRDQFKKTDVSLQVKRKKNKNYIEGALLDTSSRTLSVLTLSLNQQRFYTGNVTFQWSLGLKHGLPNFGAKESTQGDSQTLEYNALTASINVGTPFTLAKKSFNYATQWSLQLSNDNVYGSEQFSIGSQYSVRGFKGESLSSRSGHFWRHDVSYPIAITSTVISSISPYVGIDFGAIKNTELGKVQQLSGLAIGAKFNGKKLNAEVSITQAQDRLSRFSDDRTQIYFSLSYTL